MQGIVPLTEKCYLRLLYPRAFKEVCLVQLQPSIAAPLLSNLITKCTAWLELSASNESRIPGEDSDALNGNAMPTCSFGTGLTCQ